MLDEFSLAFVFSLFQPLNWKSGFTKAYILKP